MKLYLGAYFFALLYFYSQTLYASEGFNLNPTSEISAAWNSTLAIMDVDAKNNKFILGTGFILKKQKINGRNLVMMITAGHLVDQFNSLAPPGDFSEIILNKNIELKPQSRSLSQDPIRAKIFANIYKMELELGAYLLNVDDETFESLVPLEFNMSGCDTSKGKHIYSVGFPRVTLRPILKQKTRIEAPDLITKRWSQGVFTGISSLSDVQPSSGKRLIGSSLDVLGGNSGGAIVDDNGFLVGVAVAGYDNSVSESTYAYRGSDDPNHLKTASLIVSCQILKKFSEKAWYDWAIKL